MGKLHLEYSKDTRALVAEGRLTIQDAAELKAVLLEAGMSGEKVSIDLAKVESLDLACAQVLCAANKSFRKTGKLLSIRGILPEVVLQSLKDIGISSKTCDTEYQGYCLWDTGVET
jgi:anti-anti-sigma regulatory factor